MTRSYWDFRDVSAAFKKIRDFLLGRKHTLRGRFPPLVASRSIPPPDIPRGPEYKYSDNYYFQRSAMHSVNPPVVAPVGAGPPIGYKGSSINPDQICFHCPPKPGLAWWWDGHCYYEYEQPVVRPQKGSSGLSCPPSNPCKPPSPCNTIVPPVGTTTSAAKEFPIPFLFYTNQTGTMNDSSSNNENQEREEENVDENGPKNLK